MLPSVSRQYLFKLLREYLLINFNDNMDKVALVYVEILMLDKMNLEKTEQCSSTSDETVIFLLNKCHKSKFYIIFQLIL